MDEPDDPGSAGPHGAPEPEDHYPLVDLHGANLPHPAVWGLQRWVIKMLEADGWRLVRQVGSHRQFRHPVKPGTVTVATHSLGQEVKKGTLASIMRQAGLKESRS